MGWGRGGEGLHLPARLSPLDSPGTPLTLVYTPHQHTPPPPHRLPPAGHSRIPVHRPGDRGAILGIMLVKELIMVDRQQGKTVGRLKVRSLPYVRAGEWLLAPAAGATAVAWSAWGAWVPGVPAWTARAPWSAEPVAMRCNPATLAQHTPPRPSLSPPHATPTPPAPTQLAYACRRHTSVRHAQAV